MKRTRHRSTCQAFPCDNQYRAVDTTLSWSAWGMVRLLTIARKKTNDYISATEYMQFSIRQISIKDALVDCHFSSYKLNKAILKKRLIEWRSDISPMQLNACVMKEGRVINNKASRFQSSNARKFLNLTY